MCLIDCILSIGRANEVLVLCVSDLISNITIMDANGRYLNIEYWLDAMQCVGTHSVFCVSSLHLDLDLFVFLALL